MGAHTYQERHHKRTEMNDHLQRDILPSKQNCRVPPLTHPPPLSPKDHKTNDIISARDVLCCSCATHLFSENKTNSFEKSLHEFDTNGKNPQDGRGHKYPCAALGKVSEEVSTSVGEDWGGVCPPSPIPSESFEEESPRKASDEDVEGCN